MPFISGPLNFWGISKKRQKEEKRIEDTFIPEKEEGEKDSWCIGKTNDFNAVIWL